MRDLDSRNGSFVGDEQIRTDYALKPGDVVRIAHCQLAYVHDLSDAFKGQANGGGSPPEWARKALGEETVIGRAVDIDAPAVEPTSITHRRRETRFLDLEEGEDADEPRNAELDRAAKQL